MPSKIMFDYPADRRKIVKDVFLCYDDSAKGDLAVRFISLKDQGSLVILFQEPDRPFERGFIRDRILPEEFESRIINGRPLIELIREEGLSDYSSSEI